MNRLFRSALTLFTLALFQVHSSAQIPCFVGDDGLDTGTCCEKVQPKLPKFPAVKDVGVYACLRACGLENAFKVEVSLGDLQFDLCDTAVAELQVSPLTLGGPTISAKIIAKYQRTWIDATTGSQVWRFTLNGDWYFGPSIGVPGCPIPQNGNPAHSIGSIDYSCNPNGPVASTLFALNLSHLPGCVSHGPLSARPLPNPAVDRSYHLVAPSNFTFGAGTDIHGPFTEEAVRYSDPGTSFPQTYTCLSEAPVTKGEMVTEFKNCLCSNFSLAAPWVHSAMKGEVSCGASSFGFNTVDNFDPVIPTGLTGLRLGRWNGPAFPGDSELTIYVGYMRYDNPCTQLGQLNPHRVFGVGTVGPGGFLFGTPSFQPEKVFVDLQDSLVPSPFFPSSLQRIFGAPAWSSLVWNLNPRP